MLVNVWFSIKGEWQSTEGTREKTLLKTFSLPPHCLSSSEQWASCTPSFSSNSWNWDFYLLRHHFRKSLCCTLAAPVMCQQTMMLWQLCSPALLHPSPSQKLRQKLILLLLPHPISSHSCEWQGLGYVHYAKLHLCSSLLFWRGFGQYSVFVVQEFSHWLSYSTQGCCKWWFLNFTFLNKRMLRYLIRKQTI